MTQVVVTGTGQGFPLTNPHWTQTTLDGLGRPIKVQSGPGTGTTNPVTETDTQYGPCACSPTGKMTAVSQPFTPGSAAYWTTYTYDAIGRPVSVKIGSPSSNPNNYSNIAGETTYLYQANKTTVTDPAGKWKTTTTDVQGNITQVAEPDPSNGSNTLYTNYTYDVMEHLTQVSMPRGGTTQTRTFNYNSGTHLLTSETHPETGTTSYTYTSDGFTYDRLARKTDAKGQVTAYTYDAFDRVTSIKRYASQSNYNGGNDNICERVNYTYDSYSDSNFQSLSAWGHAAAVATGDPSCHATAAAQQQFTEYFSYNAAGRVLKKRLQLYEVENGDSAQNYTSWWDVGYTYDAFGQVASTTYPSSEGATPVTYTVGFDNMQRPSTLTEAITLGMTVTNYGVVNGVSYNAANQPTSTQFAAGTENRSYNGLNQLTGLNNLNNALNVSYNYPANANNGQIAGMMDNASGQMVTYTYDPLKRLSAATATGGTAWNQTYSYDGFGNLTAKNGSGSVFSNSVDQTTNRLTGGSIAYDANGNLTTDQNGTHYGYDVANRMVSATVSGGTETYAYDAGNKRISKIDATGAQTIYIYGAMGEKLGVSRATYSTAGTAEPNGPGGAGASNLICTNNVYFAGRLVKQQTDVYPGYVDSNFVAVDRLGSVRVQQSNAGAAFGASYLPFGEELNGTQNDLAKFGTYTRDASTGLDYADQRFYTSQFGRFMSADRYRASAKVNSSGSWNKYSYVQNDPVNYRDRTGQERACPDDDDTDTSITVCADDPEPDPPGGGDGPPYCAVYPQDPSCAGSGAGPADSTSPGPTGKYNQGNTTKLNGVGGAKSVLISEINNLSSNCQKVLPDKATLLSDANDLNFLDARTNQVLATALGSGNAVDLWIDQNNTSLGISPNIVVGQKFFGFNPGRQGLTLLHELLHYATQMDDKQFDVNHSIVPQVGQGWSAALTDWLSLNCP